MIKYLILAVILLAGGLYLSIKKNLKQNAEIKRAETVSEIGKNALTERNEVEEVHNEKQADIISSSDVDNNILPVGEIIKHNHARSEPCTPDCPAYHKS